jgi:hypothetical protein
MIIHIMELGVRVKKTLPSKMRKVSLYHKLTARAIVNNLDAG